MKQSWWKVFVAGIGSFLVAMSEGGAADSVPIPELARWESDMLVFGKRQCSYLVEPGWEGGTGNWMYDPERVFYQINEYTGDPSWKACAQAAEKFYRDGYVLPNAPKGPVSYQNFTRGLRIDYQRTGDPLSKQAVIMMATTIDGNDASPIDWNTNFYASRNTALSIMANLDLELLGGAHRQRTDLLLGKALGHIDQWFVSKVAQKYPLPVGPYGENIGMQAFMVGITLQALIQYQEQHPDPRIPPAIKIAVDGLWSDAWVPSAEGFWYAANDKSANGVTADLNALIAPAFAWMYLTTGDPVYRDRGDQVFAGGVRKSWLWGAKQFNESYMWTIDYVKWRQMANAGVSTPVPVLPPPSEIFASNDGIPIPADLNVPATGLSVVEGASFANITTSVTLSWDPVPGATVYAVRTNDHTDAISRDPRNNCPGNPHYLCIDGVTSTSIAVPVKAGHAYGWWVHSIDASGNWSNIVGASFSIDSSGG